MGNFFAKYYNSQSINYNGEFWEHYGILIPISVDSIPSIDKANWITRIKLPGGKEGFEETLLSSFMSPYTLDEYQQKYAIVGTDGKLYWKNNNSYNYFSNSEFV